MCVVEINMEQINQSLSNLWDKLEGWLNAVIVNLPNILIATLVIIAGVFVTKRLQKVIRRIVSKFTDVQSIQNLATTIATVILYILIMVLALSVLNLTNALTTILAGAGLAGLAIGMALQDPILNLFSGVMMAVKDSFEVGHLIETNGFLGIVKKVSLRSTHIRTLQGQEVIIPNKSVYQNPIINYNYNSARRIDISCGVSYGDDLEKVKKIALGAIRDQVDYNKDKELELFYDGFGDSSINFKLRMWTREIGQAHYLKLQSDAIMALKSAFDANDIAIPFPIRTLDFGVKGGEALAEALPEELFATAESSSNGYG